MLSGNFSFYNEFRSDNICSTFPIHCAFKNMLLYKNMVLQIISFKRIWNDEKYYTISYTFYEKKLSHSAVPHSTIVVIFN